MRIYVKSGNQNINLRIPTSLVFGRGMAWIGSRFGLRFAGDAMKNIPPEAVGILFAEFRRIKRKYGSWELVNVEASSGEKIKIVL